MSKFNVGVGDDFPLDDAPKSDQRMSCEDYMRMRRMHYARWRHHRGPGPFAALLILPVAAATVTTAILYPLATLGVVGGLGLASAAYRRGRYHRHMHGKPDDTAQPDAPKPDATDKPKDNA